jgi:hypothetical protein
VQPSFQYAHASAVARELMLDAGMLRRVRLQSLVAVGGRAADYQVGPNASSDTLRQRARCTRCGLLGPRCVIQAGVGMWRTESAGFHSNVSATSKPGWNTARSAALRLAKTRSAAFAKKSPNSRLAWPVFSHNRAAIRQEASHSVSPTMGGLRCVDLDVGMQR